MANIKREVFGKLTEYGIARGVLIGRKPHGSYFKKDAAGEYQPMGCKSVAEVYAKMRWKSPVAAEKKAKTVVAPVASAAVVETK